MSVKLNIGLSRKVGEANYGSRGASINLEVELDNGVLNDPGQLRERVHDLYVLARESVDEELQRPADAGPGEFSYANGNGHGRTNGVANGNGHSSNGHSSNGHSSNGAANGNGHSNGHVSNGHSSNGHVSNGHSSNGNGNNHADARSRDSSNGNGQNGRVEVARATQSQIRAIFAISKRQGLDPHTLISERFRVHKMEDLTIREASALIDDLKNGSAVRS